MPRPKHKSETHSFEITVPKRLFRYLTFLAKHSALGTSENAIASYLVVKETQWMLKEGIHKIKVPQG